MRVRLDVDRPQISQSGQTIVEYLLLLATVVLIFLYSIRGVLIPALSRLNASVARSIEKGFTSDLHRLPFGTRRR